MTLEIRAASYDAPVVQTLIQEMADDLAQFYGPARYPPQDPRLWAPPEGTVLVAYVNGAPVACGAIVRFDETTAEIKRMFTRPQRRREGMAAHLLSRLEAVALRLGYRGVVLETGVPQVHAQALYTAAGYSRIPCWPPHDTDSTSICFGRDLDERPPATRTG
jgi:GNAT superfamily N-acetyltransferase